MFEAFEFVFKGFEFKFKGFEYTFQSLKYKTQLGVLRRMLECEGMGYGLYNLQAMHFC